jgi:hypothetical protein
MLAKGIRLDVIPVASNVETHLSPRSIVDQRIGLTVKEKGEYIA